jgi:hypothetical protein
LPEIASAAAPGSCTWQHVRSPADEGTGQFAPQQGALSTIAACTIPHPTLACSASTSANKARIPFFTKITLALSTTARNRMSDKPQSRMLKIIEKAVHKHPRILRSCPALGQLLAIWACRPPKGRNIASFSVLTTAPRLHETTTMKPAIIVIVFISLAGLAIILARFVNARAFSASSSSGIERVRAGTCIDRYNSLLKNAKRALVTGDRATTLDLLEQAKHMIPTCPALQNESPETALLSLNAGIGDRGHPCVSGVSCCHG